MKSRFMGYNQALMRLEKIHLSAQKKAWPHTLVHWNMLVLAIKHKKTKEIIGQIPRLLLAAPGSLLGLIAEGNIGSTKMGIFEQRPTKRP